MKIDLEHLHYWMCAIRDSKDHMRTLDAFWQGQLESKEWLIDNLNKYINVNSSIDIYGGWVGVLASMLFQSNCPVSSIRSIDIDVTCENIALMMNKKEEMEGRFKSITGDMCTISSNADVVINTICEHITQDQYNQWLTGLRADSLIVVQSNNYQIDEHIRIVNNLEEFKNQSHLIELWSGELILPLYKRFMIIGKINV